MVRGFSLRRRRCRHRPAVHFIATYDGRGLAHGGAAPRRFFTGGSGLRCRRLETRSFRLEMRRLLETLGREMRRGLLSRALARGPFAGLPRLLPETLAAIAPPAAPAAPAALPLAVFAARLAVIAFARLMAARRLMRLRRR